MVTLRGSRTEGRQPQADRPPADYATGPAPPAAQLLPCACGAVYSDRPDGHTAHKAVFGHRPIVKPTERKESA